MELEGKQRLTAAVDYTAPVLRSAEPDQGVPESRRADVVGEPAIPGQRHGGPLKRNGARPLRFVIDILQADPCLDPDGQIVRRPDRLFVSPCPTLPFRAVSTATASPGSFALAAPARVGHAVERFGHDRIRADPGR